MVATVPTPKSFGDAGRVLWEATVSKYELRQDELATLKAACAEADLVERMEESLSGEPLTVFGSTGQLVAHPLVQELRQHRTTMASLLARLKLPDDAATGSNQQRDAANSRWAAAYGAGA